MKKIILVIMLGFLVALAGCKKPETAGNEFVGRWLNTHDSGVDFEITRNGTGFILNQYMNNYKKKLPAMYPLELNGKHLIGTVNSLQSLDIVIDEKTGKLLVAGREYARSSGG